MITLTRLDGNEFVLNCDLIVTIERTADSIVTITNGDRFMVKESPQDILARIVAFRSLYSLPRLSTDGSAAAESLMKETT